MSNQPTDAQIERLYRNSNESTVTLAAFKRIVRLTLEAFPAPDAPAVESMTDEQIDEAVDAWFQLAGPAIVPTDPELAFRERMRAALSAAFAHKEGGAA